MRVIGVIDLAGGLAVHARGGDRARYLPVQSVAGGVIDGHPLALARTYVEHCGLTELYVADLDAIRASSPAGPPYGAAAPTDRPLAGQLAHVNHDVLVADFATIAPVWLDRGSASLDQARHAIRLGATTVIIGLETLDSFDALTTLCNAVGARSVAFSLDLRHGAPVAPRLGATDLESPEQLSTRAVDAGVGSVILLDLSRVGAATGPNLALAARVRAAAPEATLIVGGGIRGIDDLTRLADAGCDGALVATALHDGRLGRNHMLELARADSGVRRE